MSHSCPDILDSPSATHAVKSACYIYSIYATHLQDAFVPVTFSLTIMSGYPHTFVCFSLVALSTLQYVAVFLLLWNIYRPCLGHVL